MKLMILDGNSILNRAYYGVKLLSTHDGIYTNAIFGFLNILDRLVKEEKPDALCVAFDLRAPTFRHLRYDGYKATRHPMPEELAMQLPYMKDVLRAMNIPVFTCEGWEADDILGTVGRLCGEHGWDCVIVTGDRDSLQLIDEYVRVKLDTENYRERRKETLEILAKNIAYKVKRTKKPVSLEPMNPYERRIIHSALQSDKYVYTKSEGEDPYRHVVVMLRKEKRYYDNNRKSYYNRQSEEA